MNVIALLMAAAGLAASCCNGGTGAYDTPAIPKDREIEKRVENTLKGMTLREKAGQMVQINITLIHNPEAHTIDTAKANALFREYKIGSILNVAGERAHTAAHTADVVRDIQEASLKWTGIPCIYGLDQIHGASYIADAVLFPQEVNLAATFDPVHAENMGRVLAYESRAALNPWIFSPVMDLGRDARWPRNWESWGEDPYLSSVMSKALVVAEQGGDPNHIPQDKVGTCIKHYFGYGAPMSGKDRTPAWISPPDLRERYFAPFKESIRTGALSLMVNSGSVNGVPVHASYELLTEWLKEGLNWDGMVVTDWADVNYLYERHRVAADKKEALSMAINAGIDMVMDPLDPHAVDLIEEAVNEGLIPMSRIDDAVRRVLRLKYRLGLFDNPVWDTSGYEMGRAEAKSQALQAAIESEVLLKNNGVLPVRKGARILVTGPNGNSMRALNGGWSYTWQGDDSKKYVHANTIYEALVNKFGESKVDYVAGVSYLPGDDWQAEDASGIREAVRAARRSDVVVACIGENSYCETPGNINDLNLSENQKNLVRELAKTGKPVVLVLNEGRPRILGDIEPLADAVVHVFLPSNYGGDALAELLSGDANFSAKMPYTYPKHINALHTYDYKVSENVSAMDVQWPFGYGLSYTSYEYSDFKATSVFGADDEIIVSVTVKNTGSVAGKEAVLLYSSDMVASVVPDSKRLRAFEKVSLEPGESKVVEFVLPASDLAFVGADGRWRLEEGDFRLSAGGLSQMVECTETKIWETQNI